MNYQHPDAELSDQQWQLVESLLPGIDRHGRMSMDDRRVIGGIVWVTSTGARWRDLPERYGSWQTVYARFNHLRDAGMLESLLAQVKVADASVRGNA